MRCRDAVSFLLILHVYGGSAHEWQDGHGVACIDAAHASLREHADEIASLDQAIGDGDHIINLLRDMLATKGRASFLGERSRSHIDPGARSSQIMIAAVCARLAQDAA